MDGDSYKENSCEAKAVGTGVIEIKIKTLDSKVYTCQVAKNVSVPDLKDLLASLTGVPSESQRLICRGKVLQQEHNLSTYEVEEGHTLHLVTRQAPLAAPATTSSGARPEDEDPHAFMLRNGPGQGSHSVLVGTLNSSEHLGAFPEINRIFSSVLSSLRTSNFFPAIVGAGNDSGSTAVLASQESPAVNATGGRQGVASLRQGRANHRSQNDPVDRISSNETVPSVGFMGTIPATLPQIRIVQQVVPDGLRALSQHVQRMEQVLAAAGHQMHQQESPASPDTDATSWSSIVLRVRDLLRNQAASELERLADQLVSERNASSQWILLSTVLLMQQLGALLLELGRSISTRSYSVESNTQAPSPAHLLSIISPGAGPDALSGMAPHTNVGSLSSFDNSDMLENINIHILASNLGTLPSQQGEDGPLGNSTVENRRTSVEGLANEFIETASQSVNGNPTSSSSFSPEQMLFGEHGTIRVLPTRTFVAGVPPAIHVPPPIEAGSAGMGIFYPLLARFQQLIPSQLSSLETGVPLMSSQNGDNVVMSSTHSLPQLLISSPQPQAHSLQQPVGSGQDTSLEHELPIVSLCSQAGAASQSMSTDMCGGVGQMVVPTSGGLLDNSENATVTMSQSPAFEDFLGPSLLVRDNSQAAAGRLNPIEAVQMPLSTKVQGLDEETQLQLNCQVGNGAEFDGNKHIPAIVGYDADEHRGLRSAHHYEEPLPACADFACRSSKTTSISLERGAVLQDFLSSLASQTNERGAADLLDTEDIPQQELSLVLENTSCHATREASTLASSSVSGHKQPDKHPSASDLEGLPAIKRQKME